MVGLRKGILIPSGILLALGTLLAGCGGGSSTAWVPKQDVIFYHAGAAGNYQIYSMNTDGTGARPLTSAGINQKPSLTATGSKVVFESSRTGISQVFIMDGDGSSETALTSGDRPATDPAVSGDASKIVYVRSLDNITPSNIYIMNANGSSPTIIPNTSGASSPSLNYDASKITFSQFDGSHTSVFVMDIDGSNKKNIMTSPRTLGEWPKFSHDGSKIVYYASAVMTVQIVIYDVIAETETVVTDGTDNNQYPCFSPDDTKVIFARQVLGDEFLYGMGLDGTGVSKLTTGGLELHPACPGLAPI